MFNLLWKFGLFRAIKAKSARWAIYSAMSIGVGFMLVATESAHASFAQDSHELSRKLTRTYGDQTRDCREGFLVWTGCRRA